MKRDVLCIACWRAAAATAIYCEHANEVPTGKCPCPGDCYCHGLGRTCAYVVPPRVGDWMQTFTGRCMYPLDPRPDEITIEDIAHHLSLLCRYNGATRRMLSVAEHSVLVSLNVPRDHALEGLLHDASEAYLADVIRPLKKAPQFAASGYPEHEARLMAVIFEKFGVHSTPESAAAVKEIDDRIIHDEAAALMATPEQRWNDRGAPLGITVLGVPPDQAEEMFLARFEDLTDTVTGRAYDDGYAALIARDRDRRALMTPEGRAHDTSCFSWDDADTNGAGS